MAVDSVASSVVMKAARKESLMVAYSVDLMVVLMVVM